MSEVDFQNGLVVGLTLAGKNGLIAPVVIEAEGVLTQPSYTTNYDPAMFLTVNERLNTGDYYSAPTYSYVIE